MVYIICPASIQSGGPELLHQLGYKLNILGIEASMYYMNKKGGLDPVCEAYRKYNVPYSDTISEETDTVIIIPETGLHLLNFVKNFKCVIWWMSVDYAMCGDEKIDYIKKSSNVYHLVQSQYALEFLNDNLKIKDRVFYLSDYLNSVFLGSDLTVEDNERENIVVFNPKKGANATANVIFSSDYRIKWQALRGLTPDKMRETLRKAKVYIDFGEHPGKDRIPREAAMCGCCIITNRNGSAANDIDVPIADTYKFDNNVSPKLVVQCINDIFENYSEKKKDFIPYVNKISNEFIEFEKDIVKFFINYMLGIDFEFEQPEQYIEKILFEVGNENYRVALLYLIGYRIRGYEESVTIDIIETVIRMGIGEYSEAEVCALRGLKKEPENYELYFNLAQIGFITKDANKLMVYKEKAVQYSKGTSDECYIQEVVSGLKIE